MSEPTNDPTIEPCRSGNLFAAIPAGVVDEFVETLVANPHLRVERIVSTGHASPEGFWYDQDEAEWVVVVSGEAKLRVEGEAALIHLRPGDHVMLPAHRRHRVEWTTPDAPTVWLAVFFRT